MEFKERKVISAKYLPTKLPIYQTAVLYLILAHFDCSEWVWGACGVLFAIHWLAAIVLMITEKQIEIFPYTLHDDKDKTK